MPERVGILFGLGEASNTPGERTTIALVFPSCCSIITKLSSLNCSNSCVNTLRFDVFIAHFVVVVRRGEACFGAGRVLVRDIGYGCPIFMSRRSFLFKRHTSIETESGNSLHKSQMLKL